MSCFAMSECYTAGWGLGLRTHCTTIVTWALQPKPTCQHQISYTPQTFLDFTTYPSQAPPPCCSPTNEVASAASWTIEWQVPEAAKHCWPSGWLGRQRSQGHLDATVCQLWIWDLKSSSSDPQCCVTPLGGPLSETLASLGINMARESWDRLTAFYFSWLQHGLLQSNGKQQYHACWGTIAIQGWF